MENYVKDVNMVVRYAQKAAMFILESAKEDPAIEPFLQEMLTNGTKGNLHLIFR